MEMVGRREEGEKKCRGGIWRDGKRLGRENRGGNNALVVRGYRRPCPWVYTFAGAARVVPSII